MKPLNPGELTRWDLICGQKYFFQQKLKFSVVWLLFIAVAVCLFKCRYQTVDSRLGEKFARPHRKFIVGNDLHVNQLVISIKNPVLYWIDQKHYCEYYLDDIISPAVSTAFQDIRGRKQGVAIEYIVLWVIFV